MAQEFKLDIYKRDDLTNSALKTLRAEGNIPGIFYSYDSKKSIPFYINQVTLNKAKKSGARIFNIAVGNTKQNVIFKSVQYHPVNDKIIHIDLYGVNMNKAVSVKVQLVLTGTAIGVSADGGVLVQSLNEIDIECLPGDIPENIEVDISELSLGDSLRAENLNLGEKFTLNTEVDQVIASVTQAMKEEELVPDLEEGVLEGDEADETTSEEASESDAPKEEKDADSSNDEKAEESKEE